MHFFLERTLKRLEREANDELLQIHTLGAHHYTTPELYELLEELERQKEVVSTKLNRLYRLGTAIPLFVIGTFMASYFNVLPLAVTCLAGVPVMGVLFTIRSLRIRRDFPTYYDSQSIEYKIRQELKRRREESSIF